jgi:iron complex outermembrane recepter protein
MASNSRLSRGAFAVAVFCASLGARAAETITIVGRSDAGPAVAGFGDTPLASAPLQAAVYGAQRLADAGATRIGDLVKLDASASDAYNAAGYWSILAVRGYTLDNRFNYRRDGLPVNAETSIALDNKERIELLKGTSGIQAGASAPGGLVNLLVKRPQAAQRSVSLGWRETGTLGAAVDIGDRSGPDGAFGWRINAAYEHLDPQVRNTQGHRSLLALATDWQIGPDTLLEAEFEGSRQQQPSVAGFSMLGNIVPDAKNIDPRSNLNHQPWNRPVVMNGNTASLRWQQRINEDWQARVHLMAQRLKSDDRTAFPYGVYDANTYECTQWCDRFAPDGSFTYWQYVSDNERRNSDAVDIAASGRLRTGAVAHRMETGILVSRYRGRFQDQVFDIAGTGRIDGSLETAPAPGYPDANTNRSERSTELYLRDAMAVGPWQLWLGLRHTRLQRDSVRTRPAPDGLRETSYAQNETLPWLAVANQLTAATLVYASWGQGLESEVAPNRARYTNAGQALPALKSRQIEAGIKHTTDHWSAALTLFDIDRPRATDVGACDVDDSCTRAIVGSARHRGAEAQLTARSGPWEGQIGTLLLDAQRQGSGDAATDSQRPENVPRGTLRMGLAHQVTELPGLLLQAAVIAEGERVVLPYDTSVRIPGWTRLDLAARWTQRAAGTTLTWRAGVDNATNRRAWKESPYQFGHVYLYPLEPRTWRATAQLAF